MIFVTVGSYEPFERLLAAVGALSGDETIVAQCGRSCVRPVRASCLDFMPFDEVVAHMRRARIVVTHAGVGSVLTALANGKRPIVVPRLRALHEAVDDHQLTFARQLAGDGVVVAIEDVADLAEAVSHGAATAPVRVVGGPLADDLRSYVAATLTAP